MKAGVTLRKVQTEKREAFFIETDTVTFDSYNGERRASEIKPAKSSTIFQEMLLHAREEARFCSGSGTLVFCGGGGGGEIASHAYEHFVSPFFFILRFSN